MKKKEIILTVILVGAMLIATAGAKVITPISVVASSQYSPAVGPGNLIDPSHLSASGQHVATSFGSNWLADDELDTSANWVYVDLGDSYSIDEIRIWNYHENNGSAEVVGRSVKSSSIWAGGENADLPAAGSRIGRDSNVFTRGQAGDDQRDRGAGVVRPPGGLGRSGPGAGWMEP